MLKTPSRIKRALATPVTLLLLRHSMVIFGLTVAEYNFEALSPIEFEALVADILSRETGNHWSTFTPGADKGIDFRLLSNKDQTSLGQAKHYPNAKFSTLLSAHKKEVPKVALLRPDTYIVAASTGLTPKQQDLIRELFQPVVLQEVIVYGRQDLVALISRNSPDIEYRHYKLWLTSATIIQSLLHNRILSNTEYTIEAIQRKLSKYVQTDSFQRARTILDTHHAVIISGAPGIGKTTLAEALLASYSNAGYRPVAVSTSIHEAQQVIVPGERTVIYYDDFLGRISLEPKLDKNEDQSLIQLINQAQNCRSIKLILTTREYILRGAIDRYERLAGSALESNKLLLDLGSYSKYDKARILYNHLYFSDIPTDHISQLAASEYIYSIVGHPNYSPRVIESMTTSRHLADISATDYPHHFLKNLNDPANIYRHIFENQLTEDEQVLTYALFSIGNLCRIECLKLAFSSLLAESEASTSDLILTRRFEKALRRIDDTLVRTLQIKDEHVVSLINPSVQDYLASKVEGDPVVVRTLIRRARFFEQSFLSTTWDFDISALEPLEDLDDFVDAITRTIDSPLPLIENWKFYAGQTVSEASQVVRVGVVLEKLRKYKSRPPATFLTGLLQRLVAGLSTQSATCAKVSAALAAARHCGFFEDESLQEVEEAGIQCMLNVASKPEDWLLIANHLRVLGVYLPSSCTILVYEHFDQYLSSALSGQARLRTSLDWSRLIDATASIYLMQDMDSSENLDRLQAFWDDAIRMERDDEEAYDHDVATDSSSPIKEAFDLAEMFKDLVDGQRAGD